MTRVAIFDLDGTLIDSRLDLATSGNYARTTVGLPPLPVETVLGYVGDGLDRLIERLVPSLSKRVKAKEQFSDHYLQHCCDKTQPYDDIVATLSYLASHAWTLAVATNKPGIFTDAILSGCKLRHFFNEVRSGDGARKPDPGQLIDIMSTAGATPADCWMIGDHHTDVRAGQAAGCRVAFCAWGIGHTDGLPVTGTVTTPSALIKLLAT